jgi:hypothetical protein
MLDVNGRPLFSCCASLNAAQQAVYACGRSSRATPKSIDSLQNKNRKTKTAKQKPMHLNVTKCQNEI